MYIDKIGGENKFTADEVLPELDNLFVLALHCLTIERRGDVVSALEEFDKVRDIGKGAVGTNL